MKIRKLIALFTAVLLVFSLAACGGSGAATQESGGGSENKAESGASKEAVTIRMAIMGEGTNKDDTEKILDEFEKENSGIKVDTLYLPVNAGSGWNDFFTKIQTMVAGGNSPDLALVAIEGIQMFVKLGLALPMDEYFGQHPDQLEEARKDIHPKLQAPFSPDGKTYALVTEWNNVVMHFNTKLLEEAGLQMPSEDWNLSSFLEYAKNLTKTSGDKKQYGFTIPNYYFGASAWLFNNNASVLNEDMTKCTLNQPNAVEVFQLWQDLIHKYKYAPMPEPGTDSIQQLIDGQAAMGCWGRWPTTNYVNNKFDAVAVQYLPTLKSKNVIFGSAGFVTVKGTKHPEEAVKVAVWTADKYFVKNYYSYGAIPARKSVADEVIPKLGIPKNHEVYYKSADLARPVESPPTYAEIATVFDRYMSAVLANEMTAQNAMDKATEEIDVILAKNPAK